MAGVLGFGNFQKPGKGVKKNEPEKKRFFQFFELFFRKLTKLIQLNLLYLLFCIPIITIGPATAAMMKILRYYVEEKPVFMLSDFWAAFKENFLQGLLIGILQIVGIWAVYEAFLFYYTRAQLNGLYWILIGLIIAITILSLFAGYYVYLMMVSVRLTFWQLIKNSYMFAFIGIRTNVLTLLFSTGFLVCSILFIPYTIIVLLLITFSFSNLICAFNMRPYVYRYLMKPYYEYAGIPNPYEPQEQEEEPVFQDTTE